MSGLGRGMRQNSDLGRLLTHDQGTDGHRSLKKLMKFLCTIGAILYAAMGLQTVVRFNGYDEIGTPETIDSTSIVEVNIGRRGTVYLVPTGSHLKNRH